MGVIMLINKKIRCPFCFSGLHAEQAQLKKSITYIDIDGNTYKLKGTSTDTTDIHCAYNKEHKLPPRLLHIARRILAQGRFYEAY